MARFNTFGELSDQFRRIEKNWPKALNSMIEMVGEESKKIAQNEIIGRTQPLQAVPPYSSWAPLADSTIERKLDKGLGKNGNPNSMLYASGEMEQSINYRVVKSTHSMYLGSPLEYAAVHEYGSLKVPPRPFLGPAVIMAANKLYPRFEKIQTRVLNGLRAF